MKNKRTQVNHKQHRQTLMPDIFLFSFLMLKVLSQDDTPFLYSVVFGEGVVNDATSIVLFNAVQSLDFSNIGAVTALNLFGTFLYLFFTSTALGVAVILLSLSLSYLGEFANSVETSVERK